MHALLYVIFLTVFANTTALALTPEPVQSLPALPQSYLEEQYKKIQNGFEQRALLYLKGRPFQAWRLHKSRQDILKEFEDVNQWRMHTWYVAPNAKCLISRKEFMISQDLLEKGYYRKPAFIAFDYNHTDGSYNSSTIVLNGFKFLALEGPSPKTIRNFFTLLQNHHATQLVRLTAAHENGTEKSYAYWTNKLVRDAKTNGLFLQIPQESNSTPFMIRYYATEAWNENQGFDPKSLLLLIQRVRQDHFPEGIIACHSSHGTGRAGTFLAGFLLLNEIDKQIAAGVSKENLDISIEKIVMQLSLQRSQLIRKPDQYLALYRLVDYYVQGLK